MGNTQAAAHTFSIVNHRYSLKTINRLEGANVLTAATFGTFISVCHRPITRMRDTRNITIIGRHTQTATGTTVAYGIETVMHDGLKPGGMYMTALLLLLQDP